MRSVRILCGMALLVTLRSDEAERLHEDALAPRHVAPLFLDDDEAVGLGHGGEDAGALRAGGAHLPGLARVGQDAALELAPPRLLAQRLRGHGVEAGREEGTPARQVPRSEEHT